MELKGVSYKTAIEEYNRENEDGRSKLVYSHFGLAVYYSQCLEETFSIMLITALMIMKKIKTNKEANEIIDSVENTQKTMGKYINEVKQFYKLSAKHIADLKEILIKRNYLSHRFFKLNSQKVFSDLGRKEMIKYCCDFTDKSKQLDIELEEYYSKYKKKLGITDEIIQEQLVKMKENEIEREKKQLSSE